METKTKAIKKVALKDKVMQTVRSGLRTVKLTIRDNMSFETFAITAAAIGTGAVMIYGVTVLTLSAILAAAVVIGLSGSIFNGNT